MAWAQRQVVSAGAPPRSVRLHILAGEKDRWLGVGSGLSQPDALAMQHQSLTALWWPGEILPRRSWDSQSNKKSWRWPNFAKRRAIAPGSTVHQSVVERLNHPPTADKPTYKPKKLPPLDQLTIEE